MVKFRRTDCSYGAYSVQTGTEVHPAAAGTDCEGKIILNNILYQLTGYHGTAQ